MRPQPCKMWDLCLILYINILVLKQYVFACLERKENKRKTIYNYGLTRGAVDMIATNRIHRKARPVRTQWRLMIWLDIRTSGLAQATNFCR